MAQTKTRNYEMARYWPFGVGGLLWPLLAGSVSRWMPFPLAAGVSMCVTFAAAIWVFRARTSRPEDGPGRAILAIALPGCAAGLVAGVLAFLFPWR